MTLELVGGPYDGAVGPADIGDKPPSLWVAPDPLARGTNGLLLSPMFFVGMERYDYLLDDGCVLRYVHSSLDLRGPAGRIIAYVGGEA